MHMSHMAIFTRHVVVQWHVECAKLVKMALDVESVIDPWFRTSVKLVLLFVALLGRFTIFVCPSDQIFQGGGTCSDDNCLIGELCLLCRYFL